MSQPFYLDPSRRVITVTVSIANGASLSGEIALRSYAIKGFITPATIDGTAFTFQGAEKSGGTYRDVYDDAGAEVSITMAAARYVALTGADAEAMAALEWIKLRTGATGSPSAQSAAREIILVLAATTK